MSRYTGGASVKKALPVDTEAFLCGISLRDKTCESLCLHSCVDNQRYEKMDMVFFCKR